MKRYLVRPRVARNTVGKIFFILNTNSSARQEYAQEVQVGECTGAGDPCGAGSIFPSLDTFCKQVSNPMIFL